MGFEPGEIEEVVVLAERGILGIVGFRGVGRALLCRPENGDPILDPSHQGLTARNQPIHRHRTGGRAGLPLEATENEAQA
jgi:hypothetical protein